MAQPNSQSLIDLMGAILNAPGVDVITKIRAGFLLSFFKRGAGLGSIFGDGGLYHGLFR